jgi:hypothetical protein
LYRLPKTCNGPQNLLRPLSGSTTCSTAIATLGPPVYYFRKPLAQRECLDQGKTHPLNVSETHACVRGPATTLARSRPDTASHRPRHATDESALLASDRDPAKRPERARRRMEGSDHSLLQRGLGPGQVTEQMIHIAQLLHGNIILSKMACDVVAGCRCVSGLHQHQYLLTQGRGTRVITTIIHGRRLVVECSDLGQGHVGLVAFVRGVCTTLKIGYLPRRDKPRHRPSIKNGTRLVAMSHVFYDTLWQQANEELTDLIGIECPPLADPTQPVPKGPVSLSVHVGVHGFPRRKGLAVVCLTKVCGCGFG